MTRVPVLMQISMLLAGQFAISSCRSEATQHETSRAPFAKLQIRAPLINFGQVTEGDPIQHTFRLENAGTSALVLENVERVFGCEAALPNSREIAPGKSLDVLVNCDTEGRTGNFRVALPLRSNDATSHVELTLVGRVVPLLGFEPFLVELVAAHGETTTREARLVGARVAQATLAIREVEAGGPSVELVAGNAASPPALKLTLTGDSVRNGSGRVVVSTGLEKPRELMLSYLFRVTGNVELDPSRPYINLRLPGPKTVAVKVTSRRSDFEVRAVEIVEGPFAADFVRADDQPGYTLRITVLEAKMDEANRGVNGKLLLVSNDPAEPAKEISVFAFGILNRTEPKK